MNLGNTTAVQEIRVLIAEIVENAKGGHPGGPMGMANIMNILYSKILRVTNIDSKWINRDIFILSNGHCCAVLYICLFLKGFITMEDLLSLRKLDSKTPGHPEHNEWIEATTGPLGQGVAQAVGYAIALKSLAEKYNKPALKKIITNKVYCMVGDGCLQEGVAQEALSLAGHFKLDNLIMIYDYNKITIDGDLALSNTENIQKKLRAMGFAVLEVEDSEDTEKIEEALTTKPGRALFVIVHTVIGYDSIKQGTCKAHGSVLGEDEIQRLKKIYNIAGNYYISEETKKIYVEFNQKIEKEYEIWKLSLESYRKMYPEEYRSLINKKYRYTPELVENIVNKCMQMHQPAGQLAIQEKIAEKSTRELAGEILNELSEDTTILGGSADLSESTCAKWKDAKVFSHAVYEGRYICYGVREHAMCGILNGIAAFGHHRVYGSTFLNFLTYGFPAIRLAAISSFPVTILGTHDSIALGGDGPTHQPIETLALFRATPNLITFRPANRLETYTAIVYSLYRSQGPCVIALSRQKLSNNVPVIDVKSILRGGYVVSKYQKCEHKGILQVLLIATGSEVSLAMKVKKYLSEYLVCVVSMVSFEMFSQQDITYQKSVLKGDISISIEALSTFGWSKYSMYQIGVDTFGKSGDSSEVYENFGFMPEIVAEKVRRIIINRK